MGTIYRGVARDHPGYADAQRGIARPRNPDGTITADEHNLALDPANSPYTSWTHDLGVARIHAGPDGLILQLETGLPPEGSTWRFEMSPDEFGELEVLIRGTIEHATVREA